MKPRKPKAPRQWNSTLPQRKTWLAKGVKPRPKNAWPKLKHPSRHGEEWHRVYGSKARVRWIAQRPSIVSGKLGCENVHVKSGGMGRKADACWIIPLTPSEHRELHQHGAQTFEAKYGIDLLAAAQRTEAAWQASQGER